MNAQTRNACAASAHRRLRWRDIGATSAGCARAHTARAPARRAAAVTVSDPATRLGGYRAGQAVIIATLLGIVLPADCSQVTASELIRTKLGTIDAKPEMFGAEHTMVAGERRSPTAAQAP